MQENMILEKQCSNCSYKNSYKTGYSNNCVMCNESLSMFKGFDASKIYINKEFLQIIKEECNYAKEKHPIFAKNIDRANSILTEEFGEFIQASNNLNEYLEKINDKKRNGETISQSETVPKINELEILAMHELAQIVAVAIRYNEFLKEL